MATTTRPYCGREDPFTLYSSTGYMGIRMVTDSSTGSRGFNATYKILPGKFVGNLPFDISYLTTSTQTFQSVTDLTLFTVRLYVLIFSFY